MNDFCVLKVIDLRKWTHIGPFFASLNVIDMTVKPID